MRVALFDTNNHPTPILREWSIGFIDLGHDVTFYPIENYTIGICANKSYDLIVYVGPMHVSEFEAVKIANPNTIIVCAADGVQTRYSSYLGLIDFFITTQHHSPSLTKSFKDIGFYLYNVPLAGNNHLFYPTNEEKKYDISFIGTLAHGDRNESKYLYPLIDNPKYNFYLAGMTYGNHGISFIPYEQSNIIRNSTKVNINFHYDYQIGGKGEPTDRIDLNQSVYNIALAGAFQVCDHPLASQLFNGAIVLADFNSWNETIDYYINNREERERLALKAYEIAIEKHTWKARMNEFLQIIENHKKCIKNV